MPSVESTHAAPQGLQGSEHITQALNRPQGQQVCVSHVLHTHRPGTHPSCPTATEGTACNSPPCPPLQTPHILLPQVVDNGHQHYSSNTDLRLNTGESGSQLPLLPVKAAPPNAAPPIPAAAVLLKLLLPLPAAAALLLLLRPASTEYLRPAPTPLPPEPPAEDAPRPAAVAVADLWFLLLPLLPSLLPSSPDCGNCCCETVLYTPSAWATMEDGSPAWAGSSSVLVSLAR